MKAFCYILYSAKLSRFYIGSTELPPKERLNLHISKHYGDTKFTAKATDWKLYLSIDCKTIKQAREIERYIKRMKSSTYIKKLKDNDNRIKWLLENID